MKFIHISRAALEPWAILPESLAVVVEIVTRHFSGDKLDPEEVQMRIHGAKRPDNRVIPAGQGVKSVAVLPLFGTIFPRANLMTDVSGATSAEMYGKQFDALMNDPEIGAIVLDVDSPGGQASGIEELSQKIYDARGRKPVVAVANHTMASGAYWIGTAADELVVSPSGEVGSIGVIAMHQDISAALEKEGITVTLLREGKYKGEGNPYEPLSEETRAAFQTRMAEIYDGFVNAVARNRGAKATDVRGGFGEGRMVGAKQAVELGMADKVATLDETIAGLLQGGARTASKVAAATGMIVPPGDRDDKHEVIPEEAAGVPAAEADNKDAPREQLRNYLIHFRKGAR